MPLPLPLTSRGSLMLPSPVGSPSSHFSSPVLLEIGEYLLQLTAELKEKGTSVNELSQCLTAIKLAAKYINKLVTKHSSFGMGCGGLKDGKPQIEEMSELAATANKAFVDAVYNREAVAGVSTSMENSFRIFDKSKDKSLVLLIHPMDGTKQVDVNVSSGSIFSIYKRISPVGENVVLDDFLQPGRNQICAGYVLYGSSTILVFTVGLGVHGFTLDPSLGTFYMSHPNIQISERGTIYSVNGGKFKMFPLAVRDFIDYCQLQNFSFRYIGSLVADFHRNMLKGGIYIYPPTFMDPTPSVNMIFQCNPLAFITEQAGGKASDGFTRIVLIEPVTLNDRLPFFCGSKIMVEGLELFMAKNKLRDGGWCFSKFEKKPSCVLEGKR